MTICEGCKLKRLCKELEYMGFPKGCPKTRHEYEGKMKHEPNTNADRIRAMTDEELAEFLAMCDASRIRIRFVTEDVIAETWRWLDWLRQEVRKRGA